MKRDDVFDKCCDAFVNPGDGCAHDLGSQGVEAILRAFVKIVDEHPEVMMLYRGYKSPEELATEVTNRFGYIRSYDELTDKAFALPGAPDRTGPSMVALIRTAIKKELLRKQYELEQVQANLAADIDKVVQEILDLYTNTKPLTFLMTEGMKRSGGKLNPTMLRDAIQKERRKRHLNEQV